MESKKIDQKATAGDPVSAVRLPAILTAQIDAWARAQGISRSEAIRRLVELLLKSRVEESPSAYCVG